jgi:hypothetical protein
MHVLITPGVFLKFGHFFKRIINVISHYVDKNWASKKKVNVIFHKVCQKIGRQSQIDHIVFLLRFLV